MKKRNTALAILLCTAMLFSSITVFADADEDNILTLEKAKQIALDNDVQFKLQQSYIKQKSEDYDDIYDIYSRGPRDYDSVVQRAEAEIEYKMTIERAASAVRQEIFKRNDLKRKSDYEVTNAYYNVMTSNYEVEDAQRAVDIAKKDLDVAKIKLEQGLITKNMLSQYESEYRLKQTEYNKAFTGLQNNMASLSKLMGKNLDVFNTKIDMTISMPNLAALDLNKIKEDYMKQSPDFYALSEALDMAEYKQQLTEDKYDYYFKRLPHRSTKIEDELNDMKYKADRDYDNAKYQYQEAEKALDVLVNTLYSGIHTLQQSIWTLQKNVEDTKVAVEHNQLKRKLEMITALDLEKSESALKELENTLNKTIITINKQYLELTQYSYEPEK